MLEKIGYLDFLINNSFFFLLPSMFIHSYIETRSLKSLKHFRIIFIKVLVGIWLEKCLAASSELIFFKCVFWNIFSKILKNLFKFRFYLHFNTSWFFIVNYYSIVVSLLKFIDQLHRWNSFLFFFFLNNFYLSNYNHIICQNHPALMLWITCFINSARIFYKDIFSSSYLTWLKCS